VRIIILGASGLIGRQLRADAKRAGHDVIGTYLTQPGSDLRRFDLTRDFLYEAVPDFGHDDAVFLLSAQIDPNWVFRNPEASQAINVDATCRLIDEANDAGAKLFFLSSEMVFDGRSDEGYTEDDAPVPLTLYGRQKVEVEDYLRARAGDWCVVRTGWTISPEANPRCPIESTYAALLNGTARLATDNLFTLTDVRDLSQALIRLFEDDHRGLFHVAANPPVVRANLGRWIADASTLGKHMAFEKTDFASLPFTEPRPAKSWLRSEKYVAATGHQLQSPWITVANKVAMIDAKMMQSQAIPA